MLKSAAPYRIVSQTSATTAPFDQTAFAGISAANMNSNLSPDDVFVGLTDVVDILILAAIRASDSSVAKAVSSLRVFLPGLACENLSFQVGVNVLCAL